MCSGRAHIKGRELVGSTFYSVPHPFDARSSLNCRETAGLLPFSFEAMTLPRLGSGVRFASPAPFEKPAKSSHYPVTRSVIFADPVSSGKHEVSNAFDFAGLARDLWPKSLLSKRWRTRAHIAAVRWTFANAVPHGTTSSPAPAAGAITRIIEQSAARAATVTKAAAPWRNGWRACAATAMPGQCMWPPSCC